METTLSNETIQVVRIWNERKKDTLNSLTGQYDSHSFPCVVAGLNRIRIDLTLKIRGPI